MIRISARKSELQGENRSYRPKIGDTVGRGPEIRTESPRIGARTGFGLSTEKSLKAFPKGPFRTKNATTIVKIVNYYAVVFLLRPPNLLRRGPFFERKNVCNSQEMVSVQGAPR